MSGNLTDRKILIFDVYGTLMDWETGIYNGLKPLLSKFSAPRAWDRKEALQAFSSVETDLQTQYPNMLYHELLANVHEVLEQRLKALSSQSVDSSTLDGTAPQANSGEGSTAGASTSADDPGNPAPTKGDSHIAFGHSVKDWPIFPDTAEALKRLSKHYKLVVLSNVDRESFQTTLATLSEGKVPSDITPYLYPPYNPNKFWHPRATPGSQSPFTVIATAQDTGCYKPALGGFQALLEYAQTNPDLLGNNQLDGDVKSKVLIVAQSLPHDHVPASQLGISSVWIDRQSAVTCKELPDGQKPYAWRFETLGDMADAVEKEAGSA
ncbi:haloacid dehalogenase [Coprinopsis sp. MPI-PUGE-AT-0042]|nr:haloacid dehalogenase [Coprinopsis sp. MPI-PUGE-AT-0042]